MKKNTDSGRIFSRSKKGLFFALFLVTIFLVFPARSLADISSSQQVSVTASVKGPPPTTAAIIESPFSGQVFSSLPVKVSGSCSESGLIIKIIDNSKFVGSTICKSDGTFAIGVNLFVGNNDLIAQVFDALDQQGPDSPVVPVVYKPTSYSASNQVTELNQLTISLDENYNGYTKCASGQLISLPLRASGGTPPYALNVDWDDGTNKVVSLKSSGESLIATHAYNQPGTYEVIISASDAGGQQAELNVVVIVSGVPQSTASGSSNSGGQPLQFSGYYQLASLLLLPLGFILGKSRLRHPDL